VIWDEISNLYADKLVLVDKKKSWKAELQAMTESKFHLHVESMVTKNLLLFSGIVEKQNLIKQLFACFF
jgi:hypothetical protein